MTQNPNSKWTPLVHFLTSFCTGWSSIQPFLAPIFLLSWHIASFSLCHLVFLLFWHTLFPLVHSSSLTVLNSQNFLLQQAYEGTPSNPILVDEEPMEKNTREVAEAGGWALNISSLFILVSTKGKHQLPSPSLFLCLFFSL
jgi:hypothetical protein